MLSTHELPPAPLALRDPVPQTVNDLYRLGWKGYREHFNHLSLLWIAFLVPLMALAHVLSYRATEDLVKFRPHLSGLLTGVVVTFGLCLAVHSVLWKESSGTYPGLLQSLRFAAERFTGAVLANMAAVILAMFGLILLIVPGIILLCGFALVPQIVVAEGTSLDAIEASWERTRGRRWVIFLFVAGWYLGMMLMGLLAAVMVMVPAALVFQVSPTDPGLIYWIELGVSLVAIHLIFIMQFSLWHAAQAWKPGASWAPAPAAIETAPVAPPSPSKPVALAERRSKAAPSKIRRSRAAAKPRKAQAAPKPSAGKRPKAAKPRPKAKRSLPSR